MAHNYYQQPGGEDQVFKAESRLLERHGHSLFALTRQNSDISTMNPVRVARDTVWNPQIYREIRQTIRRERIDVVHFHNTFPMISPSAYYAARSERVPVIQTLHNFRILCPGSLLYRDGHVCETCVRRPVPWPGVVHKCYRNSRVQTGVVTGMVTLHRMLQTWSKAVDVYIALTEFSRDKFVEGGFPADKIALKSNFLDADPGQAHRGPNGGDYALYAGRLTQDKGLQVLLDAWRELNSPVPLRIAGAGPLLESVRRQAETIPGIQVLGATPHSQVIDLMKNASVLIVPSLWYEGLPLTVVEAYATGLPVIASNLGSLKTLVKEGVTGFHFAPGDSGALARCVEKMLSQDHNLRAMGANARAAFLADHSPEVCYETLMSIYEKAIERRRLN
jgi:glycosyltransferase involved in cell wall biosynthesis